VQTPAVRAGNLSVPWDCAFIDVLCGGAASCATKPCGRPNGENHKGALDWWRREKLEYGVIGAIYGADASR
jgi:hypothetical protein